MDKPSQAPVSVLQAIALTAPAIYTGTFFEPATLTHLTDTLLGFTFAYSHVVVPPMVTHAPPKLLAKQWLQAYQFAPVFVAPLILLGASCNTLLSYLTVGSPSHASLLYAVAAVGTASIIPYTALYMEPGVNGAGKWKVQVLLRNEGVVLKGVGQGTDKDTARASAKTWAESVDMQTIVETWARTNAWRYVITSIATVISATATVIRT